jgi:hypothetical protein
MIATEPAFDGDHLITPGRAVRRKPHGAAHSDHLLVVDWMAAASHS